MRFWIHQRLKYSKDSLFWTSTFVPYINYRVQERYMACPNDLIIHISFRFHVSVAFENNPSLHKNCSAIWTKILNKIFSKRIFKQSVQFLEKVLIAKTFTQFSFRVSDLQMRIVSNDKWIYSNSTFAKTLPWNRNYLPKNFDVYKD